MKDDRVYLLHIRDAMERALRYAGPGKEEYLKDTKTQDAIIRNLEIIGEAAKRVSETFRQKHGDIPWKEMAGMRDRMIYDYMGVDIELVWSVVEQELPKVAQKIGGLLSERGQ